MPRPRPLTLQSAAVGIVVVLLAVVGQRFTRNTVPDGARPDQATPNQTTVDRTPREIPQVQTPAAPPRSPSARSSDVGFRSRATLEEHFRKHGREFGPNTTMNDYLRQAQSLRDAPAGGPILEQKRADNVTTRFDRRTGDFIAVNPDATIRTFFRPNDGEPYFHRQLQRPED